MSMRATILVVDDSEDVLNLIQATLSKEHDVRVADNAAAGLRLAFEEPKPELILLDVEMPDVSGYDLCKTLKGSPAVADIPIVFLTGRTETRDVVQGFQLGALDYLAKPVSPPVLQARIRNHLELIERRNKQDDLLRMRGAELEQTRLELIRRLGRAMEYHESSAIGNRVIRLGHYARALAQAAGARVILTDMLMKAAPLHDIGKVGVPAAILRKSGQLTVPEREQMQRHPEIGAEIIGNHNDPLLKLARTLAFTHHERWDGSGYPSRAAGNDIPWAGRVMAIVDSWESMTVTQFHREPLPLDLAADEIVKGAGKQFDPAMVNAFKKALPEFRRIHATYADQLGDMLNLDFSAAPAPKQEVGERQAVQEQAAEALRAADAARAKALADAQARLKIEHELAAAAQKDIVSQHTARKAAEEQAAREAELLAAAKKRAADESAAGRFARDRAEADSKATDLARQHQEAQAAAEQAAKERAQADKAAAEAAQQRAEAEKKAQGAAFLRVQAEKEAQAAARLREQAEAELEALRAAAAAGAESAEALTARIVEDTAAAHAAREAARAAAATSAPDIAALEAKAREIAAQRAQAEAELERIRASVAGQGERVAMLEKQLAEDTAAARAAREAAQAAAQARAQSENALDTASRARQEAQAEVVRLREASVAETERLAAVRKRVEEETAAANAARAAAAQFANVDEQMRERMALEKQLEALANQRADAEKALEGLRQAAERERAALEDAKERLAAIDLKALTQQRTEIKGVIAGLVAERERLEQKALDERSAALHRQLDEARGQLAAAQQELVTTKDEVRAATEARARAEEAVAEARATQPQPLVIGPPPVPVPPRRASALAGFVLGLVTAGAAAWFIFSELERMHDARAVPPPPPPVAEAKPMSAAQAGEPLKLRLDGAYERIAPKEYREK